MENAAAEVVQGQRKGVVLRDLDAVPWLQSVVARPAYDVSPDGNRFLLVLFEPEAEASAAKIRVVQNWHEEFRDREQD